MLRLLRSVITTYEPINSDVDVAVVLLDHLPRSETRALLATRVRKMTERRAALASDLGVAGRKAGSAGDHMLSLLDADLRWLRRALAHLKERTARRDAGHKP